MVDCPFRSEIGFCGSGGSESDTFCRMVKDGNGHQLKCCGKHRIRLTRQGLQVVFFGVVPEGSIADLEQLGSLGAHAIGLLQGPL
jgi:hypothetical protein